MGNQNSNLQYSVECSQKKEGETSIRRSQVAASGVITTPEEGIATMQDAWLKTIKLNGNQMALFTRNRTTNVYEGKTYQEIHELARAIGSGLISQKLLHDGNEDHRFPHIKMIGIFAKNCEEWTIVDVSNMLYGNVMIPLYDTLGPQNITYCLKHSGITSIFATAPSVTQLAKTSDIGNLKTIITIGEPNPQDKEALVAKGLTFMTWDELVQIGKANLKDFAMVMRKDCLTFSYTSGTTGDPKAAMMSHANFISVLATLKHHPSIKLYPEDIHLSFYSGDVQKLKDDLAIVRPTFFISVPRLYNRFYDLIRQNFDKVTGVKKTLLNLAMSTKMENLKEGKYTHMLYDNLVFKQTKAIFGGRCRFLITSSAPISKDVIDFMKVISCSPMVEGYGQTESTGASFATVYEDPETGTTGGPCASVEFKLVDIPEMNYLSTDKNEKGEDQPRGEICFGGAGVFMGYYKDPVKTNEVLDQDGWLHSGDVGVILAHNKALKIIDRKKNIFKLQQGEYVAPEKVENCYLKVRGMNEVFVHGDSLQSYTVAVVVPDKKFIEDLAKEMNIEGTFEQLCQNPQIVKAVLALLEKQGRSDKLAGFELAKKLYLHPESMANLNCMTNTMKIQRHNAKEVFKAQIAKMYSEPLAV